jgi:hypothetical protein
MYSDVIFDILVPFQTYLKKNGYPNLSNRDIKKLKNLLITMFIQMRYVQMLSDMQLPDGHMIISLSEIKDKALDEAIKMFHNDELIVNIKLNRYIFAEEIEKILAELIDNISKEYCYKSIYTDTEVIDMLMKVKSVIHFLDDVELSDIKLKNWATGVYTYRVARYSPDYLYFRRYFRTLEKMKKSGKKNHKPCCPT